MRRFLGSHREMGSSFSRVKPQVEDPITRVEFKNDESKTVSTTPKQAEIQTYRNKGSTVQHTTYNVSGYFTNTSEFHHQNGRSIDLGLEFSCGVPTVGEVGGSAMINLYYSHTWGKTRSISKSFSQNFPIEIPPHPYKEVKAVYTETQLEVPYTIHFRSGNHSSGIWKGVSSSGLDVEFNEKSIPTEIATKEKSIQTEIATKEKSIQTENRSCCSRLCTIM